MLVAFAFTSAQVPSSPMAGKYWANLRFRLSIWASACRRCHSSWRAWRAGCLYEITRFRTDKKESSAADAAFPPV